jgi:hypothetical protein
MKAAFLAHSLNTILDTCSTAPRQRWVFLRWHRLQGVSSEVKASIDGRLIRDIKFEFESRFRVAFLLVASVGRLPKL